MSLGETTMQYVNIGARQVAAEIDGNGDPSVVFIAAWSESGVNWAAVRELLQIEVRQVAYDRAGIGQSPPRPDWATPQPYSGFAAELAALLDALDITKPVILVGHSFGSLIVRAFTARWPERVAGMVHVDGSMPKLRWPTDDEGFEADGDDPQATRIDIEAGVEELRSASPASAVPSVVLTRMPNWQYRGITRERDIYWQQMQRQLAIDLGATQIIATDSGHRIQRENPGLVAYCVERVVSAVQAGGALEIDRAVVTARRGHLAS
jgi:pimeloyl-ACP methyl ester carboxylesterase